MSQVSRHKPKKISSDESSGHMLQKRVYLWPVSCDLRSLSCDLRRRYFLAALLTFRLQGIFLWTRDFLRLQ